MALYDFYFHWVANGGTTFGVDDQVHDEQVVGFSIEHQERETPSMRITVRNPRVGLLNATRKQWAWVSWRKPDNVVEPLFHGRLVAMPTDMLMELVTLEFLARPEDFEEQKAALAETLKVLGPFWDPLFVDPAQLENPDVVLAARPQLWHVGRTDKLVTVSDIMSGEAGTLVLAASDVLSESADISTGQPINKVRVVSTVEWSQSAFGTVNMSAFLRNEFGGLVASYTGQGFEEEFPAYGTQIGGGWFVDLSRPNLLNTNINDSDILTVPLDPVNATPDFQIEDWWSTSVEGYDFWYQQAYDEWLREQLLNPIREARFALWEFRPDFYVRYEAARSRKEMLTAEITADVQRLAAEGIADETVQEIKADSTTLTTPDADGATAIDNKARAYFSTERGQTSIAYLLNLGRTYILMAARAVQISVEIPFLLGVNLSCRHDVILSLPELPGGVAGGKVVGYRLALDTNTGQMTCQLTFACMVGEGNTLGAPDPGVESYVDDDYVEDTYQVFYGESLQPVAGAISYVRPVYTPPDDGINFNALTPASIILNVSATTFITFTSNGAVDQTVTIGARVYTLKDALTGANQVLRGGDQNILARNLSDAINRTELTEGTNFGTGTVAHAQVSATFQDGIVRVTARVGGVAGNAIAVSRTVAGATWDNPTLENGHDGLSVTGKAGQQAAHLLADPKPGSLAMAIERLNELPTHVELALKPVTGGPFQTDIVLVTSEFMVPKTIDLSAAALP